ncbi:AraC family transcriptional regulator [Chryseolinea sp. T2]|uniref:AraC family transcriptional regulator n=1 Tax=Chryseolinea sp. T2 TaxID=3129255 RepID=UPI0030776324
MLYQSFPPSPRLQDFVRNYTLIQFQFETNRPIPPKQRSPKPEEKIVFYIKGSLTLIDPKTQCKEQPPATAIYGHQREVKILKVSPAFDTLVVYLRPGVLHKLMQQSALVISGNFCDAELFFGAEVRSINDQLMETPAPSARIYIIEQFLYAKCMKLKAKNSIDLAAEYLLADPASFSLEALSNQACLSSKQFFRRFNEQIGMNPKLFSRLSRFNHAYRFKLANPQESWSSIAQELRYTDYHHLEKEFKELAGQTPAEWVNTHMASPERMLKLR